MKNKLITDDERFIYKQQTGSDFPETRRSGRSTGIALRLISDAMANPGSWFSETDHYNYSDELKSRWFIVHLASRLIEQLQLKHFEIRKYELRYNVFED